MTDIGLDKERVFCYKKEDIKPREFMLISINPADLGRKKRDQEEKEAIIKAETEDELIKAYRTGVMAYFKSKEYSKFWNGFFQILDIDIASIGSDDFFNKVFWTDIVKTRGKKPPIEDRHVKEIEEEILKVKPKILITFGGRLIGGKGFRGLKDIKQFNLGYEREKMGEELKCRLTNLSFEDFDTKWIILPHYSWIVRWKMTELGQILDKLREIVTHIRNGEEN